MLKQAAAAVGAAERRADVAVLDPSTDHAAVSELAAAQARHTTLARTVEQARVAVERAATYQTRVEQAAVYARAAQVGEAILADAAHVADAMAALDAALGAVDAHVAELARIIGSRPGDSQVPHQLAKQLRTTPAARVVAYARDAMAHLRGTIAAQAHFPPVPSAPVPNSN
ncbi:hypothetical protein [Gemmatirosa kalamazoonensis]|uniref:hypothetical protein n=1 Tax=Gemmatirosa kalamazoonensis TaxID=861299 RepID=UPI0004AF741A|nr:hypothetical protein [Gemmatirosa kalamazoonensis]